MFLPGVVAFLMPAAWLWSSGAPPPTHPVECNFWSLTDFPDPTSRECVYSYHIQNHMPYSELLGQVEGFQWDAGNRDKNWHTHKVSSAECEEIFFNQPLVVATDDRYSLLESRFYALGRTDSDRKLFAVFALRSSLICIISARDMSRKERSAYRRFQTQDDETTHG